jgi:hypothetical protein
MVLILQLIMTMMMKMVAPSKDQLKTRGNDMLSFSKFL